MSTERNIESLSLPRQFFEELKRRRVIRVVTLYVIVLWPIIQIADILTPAIGLPATAMRTMLIVFVAGLPVVLVLAWLYDLNRGGVIRTGETDEQPGHPLIGRSTEITVISVLLITIGVLFFLQFNVTLEETSSGDANAAANNAANENGARVAASGIRAIAVLPFVSFSAKLEDQQFTDGLTEELLNVFSQIKKLRVIARTTSFAYKGVNRNVQDIGRELNVDTILEGSVRRNDIDNTIRVTAQLIDMATGTHLWSDTFDREFHDIFKIQDEIAAAVVEQLNLQLATDEAKRILARTTAAPGAMVAYSMGRSELAKRTPTAFTDAARYFTQAIAADPSYAAAHAELANAYTLQASYLPPNAPAEERDQYLTLAQVQVDKSLELDANSGAAWAAQGLIYQTRRDQDDEARTALRKAIDLNPSLAMAHMWYGGLMEDAQEMQRFYEKAFELDPRSPVAGYNLADLLLNTGREDEAMTVFSKIVEADPDYPLAYELIARINSSRGRLGEAIRNFEKRYEMQPSPDVAAQLAILWGDIGDFARADAWIDKVQQATAPDGNQDLTWLKIGSYVARGDPDAAEALMRPMLDSPATTTQDYLNAAHAGYFLGEYEQTVEAYEKARAMVPDRWDEFQPPQGEVDVAVAFAYHKLGRVADAEPILARLEEKMDSLIENGSHIQPDLWFTTAQVSAIRGATNLALIHLQRAVDEGWRQRWRPYVEPCLKDLLNEQAFVGMMQGLATRLQLIREQIAFEAEFDEGWGT